MDHDTRMFAEVMATIVFSTGAFVCIALMARILWRKGSIASPQVPLQDQRMERLELAVDAIAVEVERISEGQRFAVTLLNERLQTRPEERVIAPRPAQLRQDTPH